MEQQSMYICLWDSVNGRYLIKTYTCAIENNRHLIVSFGDTRLITILIIVKPPNTMLAITKAQCLESPFVNSADQLFVPSIATKIRRLRNRVVYITEQEEKGKRREGWTERKG